jgi:DNA repair exonuclease SbcCD ATPase subunit
MTDFDKTMTTAQFNAYYTPKKAELSGYDTKYNAELDNVKQREPPVVMNINKSTNEIKAADNNINSLNQQKGNLEQARGRAEQQRNAAASKANSGNWFTRGLYQRIFGPLVSRFQNEVNNINSQIGPIQNQINTLSATLPALNANLQNANTAKTQLDTEDSNIRNKINPVKAAQVTLITQKEYYDNREKACRDTKELIESQNNQLAQYEAELNKLKELHRTCMNKYDRKCSTKQHEKLNALIDKRDKHGELLQQKHTEYNNDCKDKIQDCNPLYSVFQEKKATYDDETNKKNTLDNEYKICKDPTKNDCKDLYNAANFNKSMTNVNIDMIKQSGNKSKEGFTQYNRNDNADATHAKLVANYKSVQNDYTKLTQHTQELNNANNNDVGKTSRYATKKQLYDNAIYTNILLTALATSMIYYVFVDI